MPNPRPRILLAVTLAEQGGAQVFVWSLCQWLHNHNVEVIVCSGQDGWLKDQCDSIKVRFIKLKHMKRNIHPWHDLLGVFEIQKLCQELKPDAIHLNSSKMGAVGSLGARLAHVPKIIYCIGGWVFLESLPGLNDWAYRLIERVSARWKDEIICVHPNDVEAAKQEHIQPRQKLMFIPNGIDTTKTEANFLSRTDARAELAKRCQTEWNDSTKLIGTIANFYPTKDLGTYLEACRKVVDQHPDVRFVVIGEGLERKTLEQKRQELKLDSHIFFPGAIQDAKRLLKAFDLYASSSNKEGMPFTILEAMAAHLPCVATNVGAHEWMLGPNGGWIVPAKEPTTLAEAINEALDHHDLAQEKAERAHQRLITEFELAHTLEAHERELGVI